MERTYVFNQDGNNGNGGGSKFDIMAMLPNLMGSKGVDPGLLALLNQGRGSQDQWGALSTNCSIVDLGLESCSLSLFNLQ